LDPRYSVIETYGPDGTLPLEKVSDLIIAGSGTWNVDVVRNNFLAPDADAILNIPLRANGGEDFLAWSLEKTGIYSVKTAYRALMIRKEHLALEEGTVMGTSTAEENTWKSLWKLRVLPKIRVFWWRVLRGILPDSVTLKRRHIKEIGRCEICLGSEEDLMHALISCSHAQRFWEEGRRMFDLKLPRLHQNTWAKDILCDPMFSDDQRCTIISTMYAIWSSRNRWVHDDEPYDPILSMRKIREELYMLEMQGKNSKLAEGQCWRPPDPGWVKINTDGAINAPEGKGGGGGVARSHLSFLGAWSKPFIGVTDPLIAEVLALRDGVIFAKLRGFSHVVMEMDSLEVVNLWSLRQDDRSIVAPILDEVGELVSDFVSFSVQHVRRSANNSAHVCARLACTLDQTCSWLDENPSFLSSSLRADCIGNHI
jgi:ribonuclease HI